MDATTSGQRFPLGWLFVVFLAAGFGGCWLGLGNVGLAMSVVCGSAAGGGMFGFLFGIPKILQRGSKDANGGNNQTAASNTNLEQVSDWLTAIIIGASLVQLQQIGNSLDWISTKISHEAGAGSAQGYATAYFSIVAFFVGGFLFVYLFTRLYLPLAFSKVEKDLFGQLQERVKEAEAKAEAVTVNSSKQEEILVNQIRKSLSFEGPQFEAPRSTGDQNKGRFEGSPSRNGRTLSAIVTPLNAKDCKVDLKVTGSPGVPLKGKVTFHLHETFTPNVVDVEAIDNVATISVIAYGAFTAGAVADEGKTKLELDLEKDPSVIAPQDWKER